MTQTVLPKYIRDLYELPIYFGLWLIASGIGATIGFYIANYIYNRFSVRLIILFSLCISGVCWILLSISNNIYSWLLFAFLSSKSISIMNIFFITAFQKIPSEDMIGRVTTVNMTVISISMPIGSLLGGIIGAYIGISTVFIIYGCVLILVSLFYLFDKDFSFLKKKDQINWKLVIKDS